MSLVGEVVGEELAEGKEGVEGRRVWEVGR